MKQIILGFIRKELAQMLRDPVMRIFLFGAPLMQLTIFGFAISTEYRNLTAACIAQADDTAMRQVYDRFLASGYFVPARKPSDHDAYELLRAGSADCVLVAPAEGLARSIERGAGRIQLLIDAENALKARAVESYAQAILARYTAEHFPSTSKQPPVTFDIRILYNPALKTAYFMVPGVMTMIICLVTIMLTSMSITREKETGTLETIIAAPVRRLAIIAGKSIPFVILGIVDAMLVIAAGVLIFTVPVRGPLVFLIGSSFVFVCATVSVGILISTFARSQQQAMMGAFMFLFPAILLSGIMFPVENMPPAIRVFAYINPLKYFIVILRNIMLKGADLGLIIPNIAVLGIMTAVIVAAATHRFRQTL